MTLLWYLRIKVIIFSFSLNFIINNLLILIQRNGFENDIQNITRFYNNQFWYKKNQTKYKYNFASIFVKKINQNFMKIGNKLKSLRVNKGYSSELVAEKLDISLITYRRYERNESVPDLNMLEKIAGTYEIPITELLVDENVIFNKGQNGGTSNNALIINQLSEKLIEQYELRLKEKEAIIIELRLRLEKFEQ